MKDTTETLAARNARRRLRSLKDAVVRHGVSIGGTGVIMAIVLIFFYLLLVVLPLFESAKMSEGPGYALPGGDARTLHLALDEHAEIGARYLANGEAVFFHAADGRIIKRIALPGGTQGFRSFGVADLADNMLVLGGNDGRVLVAQTTYTLTYPENQRHIEPDVVYPLGKEAITVDPEGRGVAAVTGRVGEDLARIVSVLVDGSVVLTEIELETNFLSGETSVAGTSSRELAVGLGGGETPAFVLMDPSQEWIYLASRSGAAASLQRQGGEFVVNERLQLAGTGERLTALRFLTGGISLLAGTDRGSIAQWFPVRDDNNQYRLHRVRAFHPDAGAVTDIASEHRRKGFVSSHADGVIAVHYTTSERTLLHRDVADAAIPEVTISPRANRIMAVNADGRLRQWFVENEHPEISWSALWGKVWYESYPEPDYVWQSSSASNEFEPKFSLTPLSFGTLKAAFYAMLIAMPLAIMGAVFTAYFMTPKMRTLVKPTVEVMEALPTVILGFLAGLWLAPLMEQNMPAVFLLLVLFPPGVVLSGFLWSQMPRALRHAVPAGWEPALLVAPMFAIGWLCFAIGGPIENLFFNGNMPQWLSNELGIDYDQRNALVVGVAMGFAVIPTIFSIAEDAVFGVPKHLSYGSLALGATPWQTLVHVVLPTASPGIFSAVMIGLGRAVGETMIVLMATGNTPILDMNMFQGMRTLSANIAVEMPESELGSSHYRVLFLAALVLFMFTFFFNTVAELIRQRLRRKYSAI